MSFSENTEMALTEGIAGPAAATVANASAVAAGAPPALATTPTAMEQYHARLMTFYNTSNTGKPAWQHVTPTPEDMAGAGFVSNAIGNPADNVVCSVCELQCFSWQSKDDPFNDHANNSPNCEFVTSHEFQKLHDIFLAKRSDRELAPVAAQSGEAQAPPKTPKKRRGKSTITKVQTVADLEPISILVPPTPPMHISISGAGVSMDLTVRGGGAPDTPSKKRRVG